ncbi:hypothetical protein L3X38_008494 [Prunus dulcis]|uniref:TF-B3 domain-containing protein n=1 Tax=Prunus dulcis TaxID=3755 RepID=A0AAD4ZWQ7_PRUDU|nr:hypothetical protein L3X38_008494 [Prunus dulcis]
MRKSGLTRGSPNLVILCLRKGVSLRKIKFLQKDTFGKALGSVDGVLSLEEGWEVFVNHHGLNIGEMVVFEHKGKMVFNVVAYESLGSEKEYELQSDKHEHDYKGKRTFKGTASSSSRTLFGTTMSKTHGDPLHAYMIKNFMMFTSSTLLESGVLVAKP